MQMKDDASDTESIDGVSPEDDELDCGSKTEWLRQKRIEFAENKYLDRLMSLVGLEEAKAMFLHARAKIQAAARRETSLRADNFDLVFAGNQGTGKSMLARLYAKFLLQEGLFKPLDRTKAIYTVSALDFRKIETIEVVRTYTSPTSGCVS